MNLNLLFAVHTLCCFIAHRAFILSYYLRVSTVTGLSDERVRWLTTIENLEGSIVNVTGDILLCSGAVAYLTPFTDSYR